MDEEGTRLEQGEATPMPDARTPPGGDPGGNRALPLHESGTDLDS